MKILEKEGKPSNSGNISQIAKSYKVQKTALLSQL